MLAIAASGLAPVAAGKELDSMENTVFVKNVALAEASDRPELCLEASGRSLFDPIDWRNINGVFALSLFVTGPEEELVFGLVTRDAIDQGLVGQAPPGVRRIEC